MNDKKKDRFKVIEIFETAVIVFNDGEKKMFDAIEIKEKQGVFNGFIKKIDKDDFVLTAKHNNNSKELNRCFIETGFIPKSNIKRIESGKYCKILKKIV